jgi:predicted nucleic acid-binding protein
MAVVIDANLALALFLRLPYSEQAHRLMDRLLERRDVLWAPMLWEYECLSGFQRAVQLGAIRPQEAAEYMEDLLALQIERVVPDVATHRAALRWAARLGQGNALNAQYVALAERLQAELWSADQRLINALKDQSVHWAHWIGEVQN